TGEFSWPLTLPATRDNQRIFGVNALHSLGLDKFRGVDYPFELRVEGETFAGNFRLTAMRNGYTGNLIGEGTSWATALGDKKLTDLQLAPVRYDGSQLEEILEKDCDETDIQFPLLSFGNFYRPPYLATQKDGTQVEESYPPQATLFYPLSVDDYLPSVYYRNVLRQIFQDIGWTLTGRVLDEPLWRETVITPAGSNPAEAWPWGALLPARVVGTSTNCYSYYDNNGDYSNSAVGFDEDASCGNIDGLDLGGEVFFLPVPCPLIQTGGTRAMDGPTATFIAPIAGVYGFSHSTALLNGHQTVTVPTGFFPTTAQRARFADVKLALLIRRGGESFNAAPISGAPVDPFTLPDSKPLGPCFDTGGNLIPQTLTGSAEGVYLDVGDSVQLVIIGRRRLVDLPTNVAKMTRREFVVNFGAVRFECTRFEGETLLQPAKFLPPLSQRDVVRDFLLRTDTVAVADGNRRTVTLLTRAELSTVAGRPVDLTGLIDPDTLEYSPAAGAGIGAVVFSSAQNTGEPLPTGLLDTVRVVVGPGTGEQRIDSLFAPVAVRGYRVSIINVLAYLPTLATAETLAQPLAEVSWDVSAQAPRLVRYTGFDAANPFARVQFQSRVVPIGRAEWTGALRFDQATGAVATYYAATVARLTRGHVAKAAVNLTPALYRQLTPGRSIEIDGAPYAVESVSQFDLADERNLTTIELLREV
ncbi:MAG TPA: hypothetical protein VF690_01195, partial [Hymenobacter sp.]